ncbi:MAG: tRNA (guanosine(46)-N7)-methyltransferase TrmB [Burkholderiaceae bacterium]|nr:tRNA (guanosine(46)-N7)-methyltransferase TrmB [Burkholderiaceae bacterium]
MTTPPRKVATKPSGRGHIRSFVSRSAHFTSGQRDAYMRLYPRHGVEHRDAVLDTKALFGRSAPIVLEIGCGMGETSAAIAAALPQTDFLGVEVYPAGVGALLRRIDEMALSNLKVIQHDAVEVVRDMIAPDSLAGVHVFFPDPWPKSRHHKRRLIQPTFVHALASRLAPGGYLHCATDWAPYALQMLAVLSSEPLLENSAQTTRVGDSIEDSEGFAPRPPYRPVTKFEKRGVALGHGVWDLVFRRRPD